MKLMMPVLFLLLFRLALLLLLLVSAAGTTKGFTARRWCKWRKMARSSGARHKWDAIAREVQVAQVVNWQKSVAGSRFPRALYQ